MSNQRSIGIEEYEQDEQERFAMTDDAKRLAEIRDMSLLDITRDSLDFLLAQLDQRDAELDQLREVYHEHVGMIRERDARIAELELLLDSNSKTITDLNAACNELEAKVESLEGFFTASEQDRDMFRERAEKLEAERDDARRALQQAEDERREALAERDRYRDLLEDALPELTGLRLSKRIRAALAGDDND